MSKFIKLKQYLTPFANLKELEYSNKIKANAPLGIEKWIHHIVNQRIPLINQIEQEINFKGKILEIGAGTCWLSAELSKIPTVKLIYALDFSEKLLEKIAPIIMKKLGAKREKIIRILADFHQLPFENNTFDFVVADAALHHALNLSLVLKELHRVLKKTGEGIMVREPVKPFLSVSRLIKGEFGIEERKYGVTENIYTSKQWLDYFKKAGFHLSFRPIFAGKDIFTYMIRFTPLRLLNNILYSRYYFLARPL